MLASLGLVFLAGLAMAAFCERIQLPRILGMLLVGILLGPHVLNLLDRSLLEASADLRQMALIIILLKAGLSLKLEDLKRVGRPAVMMSCVPASFEILAYVLLAPAILGISRIEAAVMGAVLTAVSPAVVIPRMVQLIDVRRGTAKSIPQLIMAGASCDDVFVIVLFSTFSRMAQGGQAHLGELAGIPISIVLGLLLGAGVGLALSWFFESAFAKGRHVRNTTKVIVLLGVSFLLVAAENWLKGLIPLSGLLAVVGMACTLKIKNSVFVTRRLSEKLGKLWIAAEVMLFVLVGAAVDISSTLNTSAAALVMILAALVFRAVGVLACLIKTSLNAKERLFCVIAYLPKATVQAAIGSVPLAMGLSCGPLVLSVAVMGILVTAPLGAIGIDRTCRSLLTQDGSC